MKEDQLLGKNVGYPVVYCPEILVAVPRRLNREIYQIDSPASLFCGYDAWHAYEAGFLNGNGMPVAGILKLVYPASSEYLVESKSLKLYLGSFQMTPLGKGTAEGISLYTDRIQKDLSHLLQAEVKACFFPHPVRREMSDFHNYSILENDPRAEETVFSVYQERPGLLQQNRPVSGVELKIGSHLLKSNCKITRQPDWGSVYIRIKGKVLPDEMGLLQYLVSLRNENHFHEEICEMIYKRLMDFYQPEILMVACLYTRRGGIDICPVRANEKEFLPPLLGESAILTTGEFRQ